MFLTCLSPYFHRRVSVVYLGFLIIHIMCGGGD